MNVAKGLYLMSKRLKANYSVLLVALTCGLIFVSPHFFTQILLGDEPYTPLVAGDVNFYTIEETMYASNIRDVYDGHLIVTDSQIYENKNKSNILTPWFTYLTLGLMTKLTGSVGNTFIISDFLFPALTFLVVYFIVNRVTHNHLVSILGGLGVLLISYAFALQSPAFYTQNLIPFNFSRLPYYIGRLPFTEFTFLVFALAILFVYLAIETGKKRFVLLAGLLGGLQFYTYVFNAIGMSLGLSLLFLLFLIRREFRNLKIILAIGLLAMVIGSQYILETINIRQSADYSEFLLKVGTDYGRINPLYLLRTLFYGALILPYLILKDKKMVLTILLLFYSIGLIGLNLQLILGYNIQPRHYWFAILEPIGMILITIYFYEIFYAKNVVKIFSTGLINKFIGIVQRNFKPITVVLILGLILHGTLMHISYAFTTYQDFTLSKSKLELFQWLDENTARDDVVMTLDIENNILLPVYTYNNIFLPNALISTSPVNETIERILISYKLFDVSSSYLEKLLENEYINTSIRGYISVNPENYDKPMFHYYLFHYRHMFDNKKLKFDTNLPKETILKEIQARELDADSIESIIFVPDEFRKKVLSEYSNYTSNISELSSKYKLDYIVIGPYEKTISQRDFGQSGLVSVWSNNKYTIYKIPN